jgi:hypothetical protein
MEQNIARGREHLVHCAAQPRARVPGGGVVVDGHAKLTRKRCCTLRPCPAVEGTILEDKLPSRYCDGDPLPGDVVCARCKESVGASALVASLAGVATPSGSDTTLQHSMLEVPKRRNKRVFGKITASST